ncbi:telomere length regulation protein TEL2 homolog isoform X1 [Salvia splendens]|uniref:telomere length regulation protein TEL2 homolog isoform X1 n=1 Tax=Salvia splendens TaxID=180675 RepID=UPI001C280894|nr:telomere length regulation protein TEL2 homolog isoform X1 [Salvia splendens]
MAIEGEESPRKKRAELERRVLERVEHVISSIDDAKHVDQVIIALHSLAVCLFPLNPDSVSGSVDEKYRDELGAVEIPSQDEKAEWWRVFYKGSGFRVFSRVLLYDVASNWLACFPASARKHVYDAFFVDGCATEIVHVVVPCLQPGESGSYGSTAVISNAERLLVICLLDNDLVCQMTREFAGNCHFEDLSHEQVKKAISATSQLITSIPDKARREAPASLTPRLFFKNLTSQLLHGVEEWDLKFVDESDVAYNNHMNGVILFIGEAFARISRRGSTDIMLREMIPKILEQVRSVLSSTSDLASSEIFESRPGFRFWLKIIEAVNDSHSVERIAEELLRQLATQKVNEVEGYWILWMLFSRIYKHPSVRFTFMEKFLLWKVFPTCCLIWIIHFAVLECPPQSASSKSYNARSLSDAVHNLIVAWSRREFVQSSSTEQQIYVTAALGLCLQQMTKEDLDATKDALHLILQGISCRLENPVYLIRKMASSIALVFSKIIDPNNPLYLDDSCQDETIDWDFGLATPREVSATAIVLGEEKTQERESSSNQIAGNEIQKSGEKGVHVSKSRKNKESAFNIIDPDEIIDPAELNNEHTLQEGSDYESDDSETSSASSLQPYDLTDDDADLKRKFTQLVDVVGALRKSDDAEGVEKALDVAEKLIRASPDELKYLAGDLGKALVQVRCFESTVEGEEDSAEERRQKALVGLIATRPLESLESMHKLLYSPNVDTSQRIMILDVMTDAAQELANTRILKSEHRPATLISSSNQPWFTPRNDGPPGAGSWKEISSTETPLNWSYSYERELPSKSSQTRKGKTQRWSLKHPTHDSQLEWSQNSFPQYAAVFMLPAMQGHDQKRHGVDLLGRDFVVLGKLIHTLGVCIKCAAMHPEASVLAAPLLDMLRSREISHHAEAYVRRSVLFTASCILVALHPSFVASAVAEGNIETSEGLDWIHRWALKVAESDTDRDCHTLAVGCLQLHAEMALQASRALESSSSTTAQGITLFPVTSNTTIKIPFLNS